MTTTSLLQRQSVQPLQTQVIQQPEYMQQNSQYNEQTFAQRLMGFMQRYRTALSVGTLFGLGGYAISQQEPVLAEERQVDDELASRLGEELFSRIKNANYENIIDTNRYHADIQDLINKGANVNSVHNKWSLLMHAAAHNDTRVVKMLLEAGADANFKEFVCRNSPIRFAIQNKNLEMLRALLSAGADASHAFEFSEGMPNPLRDHTDEEANLILKELVASGPEVASNILTVATKENLTGVVKICIEAGADVNAKNDRVQGAPLLLASAWGRTEITKELIKAGADVNTTESRNQSTSLILAVSNCWCDTVRTLLQAGANVNAENKKGETALSIAKEKNSTEIIKLLEEYGATR